MNALGTPVTSLDHPAITICKPNGISNAGDYVRAVFNNFEYSNAGCDAGGTNCPRELTDLRRHYKPYTSMAYLATSVFDARNGKATLEVNY